MRDSRTEEGCRSSTPASRWGPLAQRFADPDRPHRLLAIDGGGIRGVLALEVLAEIEAQLRRIWGDPELRLGDFFDYVAGTSTGAIIAAGLARGMAVEEILAFYLKLSRRAFEKAPLLRRLSSGLAFRYTRRRLKQLLQRVFGSATDLSPEHLRCLLLVVTHNASTDSPWPISSNPHARFNDPGDADCNLRIPLWQLLRASTAAPLYFPPEVIQLDPADPESAFVFEDGGTTPYNNPAFLLYRMATLPEYRLCWPSGEKKLMLVSVGTGAAPHPGPHYRRPQESARRLIRRVIRSFAFGAQVDQDIQCRTAGRCLHGDPIDWEIGDLIPRDRCMHPFPLGEDLGRAFLYARYNAELTEKGLRSLGLPWPEKTVARLQPLDAVAQVDRLRAVGRAVAARVDLRAFGALATGPPPPHPPSPPPPAGAPRRGGSGARRRGR